MMWPALIVEDGLHSTQTIILSIIIEYCVYWYVLEANWLISMICTVTANIASASLGQFLRVGFGFGWEIFSPVGHMLGTFNPLNVLLNYVLGSLINTAIEILVLCALWIFINNAKDILVFANYKTIYRELKDAVKKMYRDCIGPIKVPYKEEPKKLTPEEIQEAVQFWMKIAKKALLCWVANSVTYIIGAMSV